MRHFFLSPEDDSIQDEQIGDFRIFAKRLVSGTDAVLEIGPSYMPTFPKKEGYNVSIVDHADAHTLRAKYSDNQTQIEEVDFIWTEGPLTNLIERKFSVVYASHVIEHMTDLIRFFQDAANLLDLNGRLVLNIPDKRYCFDLFQPCTDAAKIISDNVIGRSRHSVEALYREQAHVLANYSGEMRLAWWQGPVSEIKIWHSNAAEGMIKATADHSEYVDAHEYYFTPSSFFCLVEEARYLGLIPLELEILTRARGCEFLAVLKKAEAQAEHLDVERFMKMKYELSVNIIREHQEAWNNIESLRRPFDGSFML